MTVTVHYELYQGIPALSKWITVSAKATDAAAAKVRKFNIPSSTSH